ncbi:YdcH family protein [Ferrovibrio sp.]|uniref:YdcH family protein n=1 Tax=Ferrovibrio sp. TaxID=1917215 RepID=UPI003D0F1CC1
MNFPGSLDFEALQRQLADLMSEHRDLDDAINSLAGQAHINQLQIQRMKKKKLALKDQIIKLESLLLPDIIA